MKPHLSRNRTLDILTRREMENAQHPEYKAAIFWSKAICGSSEDCLPSTHFGLLWPPRPLQRDPSPPSSSKSVMLQGPPLIQQLAGHVHLLP